MSNIEHLPFIGFIRNEEKNTYEIHLVNPTDTVFVRVNSLTGAFASDEDGVLDTSRAVKEKGPLKSHSGLLLEQSYLGGLDFVIWYYLDLYQENIYEPMKLSFNLPKYNHHQNDYLPVLKQNGMVIKLTERRAYTETIEEEIKHMDMKGGYTQSRSNS